MSSFAKVSAVAFSLIVLALFLALLWRGENDPAVRSTLAESEGRVRRSTSSVGPGEVVPLAEDVASAEPERQSSPATYLKIALRESPGTDAAEDGSDLSLLPLNGTLTLVVVGSEDVPVAWPVANGHATIEQSRLPEGKLGVVGDAGSLMIRFLAFRDDTVNSAWSVVPSPSLAFDGCEHDVLLCPADGWPILVDSSQALTIPDSDVRIRLQAVSAWRSPLASVPPAQSKELELDVSLGSVVLAAPVDSKGVYWIGAPGHAWQGLHWENRFEYGNVVTLDPFAHVALAAPPEECGRVIALDLFDTNPMWSSDPVQSIRLEACDDSPVEVTPGSFRASIRGADQPKQERIDLGVMTFAPLETRVIRWEDTLAPASLTMTFTGVISLEASDYRLWNLDQRGAHGGPLLLRDVPEIVDADSDSVTWRWPDLKRGWYAVQVSGYESYMARLDGSGAHHHHEIVPRSPRDLYLPERGSDSGSRPAGTDPIWFQLSVVAGMDAADLPRRPLPPSACDGPASRNVSFLAAEGSVVRVLYMDTAAAEVVTVAVRDLPVLEAELPPRTMIYWDTNFLQVPHGWVKDVRFRDDRGVIDPLRNQVFFGQDWVTGVGLTGQVPTEVYLPHTPSRPELGSWFRLPAESERLSLEELLSR